MIDVLVSGGGDRSVFTRVRQHDRVNINSHSFTGRVPSRSQKSTPSNVASQSRLNRRNNAKQVQSQKRRSLMASTRIFSGSIGAPRIVAVISLTEDVDTSAISSSLAASLDVSLDNCPGSVLWTIRCFVPPAICHPTQPTVQHL
jgi:hypothetical protein